MHDLVMSIAGASCALERQERHVQKSTTPFSTMLKNCRKFFSYFSNIFPDFKSGAQILLIHFPTFLTWMIIGFLINNFFASKWKPGKIFDNYFFFSIFTHCVYSHNASNIRAKLYSLLKTNSNHNCLSQQCNTTH